MNGAPGPADVLGLVGTKVDQVRFDACVDGGGFGLIYRGYHEGLGEVVAIKCLRIASIQRTNEAIREALAGRFRDETKLLYRLSQGNLDIVRCIGSGSVVAPRTNEYTPYMVLEWLDGCTLSAELKERRLEGLGGRPLEEAVALLDSAAGGLAYAHAHDVVHRDVKPGNLFFTRTREGVRMKVLDFGLAKILSEEAIGVRASVETGVGVHFCSPSYGAPEQFTAQVGTIGPWTDVYSLTLVLFEMMRGEKVRPAQNLAEGLLAAVDPATGSPSASSLGLHVPPAVEELLLKAVAQNTVDRPRDAGVFWSALKDAMRAAPQQKPLSPFAGTMLMQNAPRGAPHLVPHASTNAKSAGGTQPTEPPMVSRSTAPLKPPVTTAPPAPPAAARPEPLKGTLPIGALSPLAASVLQPSPLQAPALRAQGVASVAPPPHPPAPQPVPQPSMRVPSVPPATSSGSGTIVLIVLCIVLGVVGIAFYWVRTH